MTCAELLRQARVHAERSRAAPSLALPFRTANLRPRRGAVVVAAIPGKGLGLVASRALAAGTTVVCESAIAFVLDREIDDAVDDDGDDDDDDGGGGGGGGAAGADGALLVLRLCRMIQVDAAAARWRLRHLFPRTAEEAGALRPWRCGVAALDSLARAALAAVPGDLAARLPHIVRYNALDCTTGGERLSYPTLPEASLAGVGLFSRGSLFNHAADPNVARWHVGDVACFRTNRKVAAGEELTMAYCAADLLSDEGATATALRHFDFRAKKAASEDDGTADEDERPVLDVDEQQDLMDLPPGERLEALKDLEPDLDLGCDVVQCQVLRALALAASGDAEGALNAWLDACAVADDILPPNDEQVVAYRVAAAKAAVAADEPKVAVVVFKAALDAHRTAFAPGANLFALRYAPDLALDTTAATKKVHPDALWRLFSRSARAAA